MAKIENIKQNYNILRPIWRHEINYGETLRSLDKGDAVIFPKTAIENSVRPTCTRLAFATGNTYSVIKLEDGRLAVANLGRKEEPK